MNVERIAMILYDNYIADAYYPRNVKSGRFIKSSCMLYTIHELLERCKQEGGKNTEQTMVFFYEITENFKNEMLYLSKLNHLTSEVFNAIYLCALEILDLLDAMK